MTELSTPKNAETSQLAKVRRVKMPGPGTCNVGTHRNLTLKLAARWEVCGSSEHRTIICAHKFSEWTLELAMRDCTGRKVEDTGDTYLVLKEALGKTFATTTVTSVQKISLSVAALVDTGHDIALKKDQSREWHPGTGRRQHFRRVRGTHEMDVALEPFATAPIIST